MKEEYKTENLLRRHHVGATGPYNNGNFDKTMIDKGNSGSRFCQEKPNKPTTSYPTLSRRINCYVKNES